MDHQKMIREWLECYQSRKTLQEPLDVSILDECSRVHYRHLDMDRTLEAYIGNLDGFIEFLCRSWGWLVQKEERHGVCRLLINENKDCCVCPLVRESALVSRDLCDCSKAFNKRMFEKVIGSEVEVTLGKTYLRDRTSCEYIVCIK